MFTERVLKLIGEDCSYHSKNGNYCKFQRKDVFQGKNPSDCPCSHLHMEFVKATEHNRPSEILAMESTK